MRFLPLLILLSACAPQRPNPNNVHHDGSAPVVVVHNESVSLNEFQRRIDMLPEYASIRLGSIQAKRANLAGVAKFELLTDFAIQEGYAKDPEVIKKTKQAIMNLRIESKLQSVHIDPQTLEKEIEKQEKTISYALIFTGKECKAARDALKNLSASQRLKEAKMIGDLTNISSRVTPNKMSSPLVSALREDLKRNREPGHLSEIIYKKEDCGFTILTHIETMKGNPLNVEKRLRKEAIEKQRATIRKELDP